MKANDLLDAIGDIDGRYLDCDKRVPQRSRKIVFAAVSAAACISIGTAVFLSGVLMPLKNTKGALKGADRPESSDVGDAAKNEAAYMSSDIDGLFVNDPKSEAAHIFIYYPQNGVLQHDDPIAAGGCSDLFEKWCEKAGLAGETLSASRMGRQAGGERSLELTVSKKVFDALESDEVLKESLVATMSEAFCIEKKNIIINK